MQRPDVPLLHSYSWLFSTTFCRRVRLPHAACRMQPTFNPQHLELEHDSRRQVGTPAGLTLCKCVPLIKASSPHTLSPACFRIRCLSQSQCGSSVACLTHDSRDTDGAWLQGPVPRVRNSQTSKTNS